MKIFCCPNTKRIHEAAFFSVLKKQYPEAEVINENYSTDSAYLDKLIDRDDLISKLRADLLLPEKRRLGCISILETLPPHIKIANNVSRVSFDLVVRSDNITYYLEFHEEQHRKLKEKRCKSVFTPQGNRLLVPRYLQRLIRDVWRAIYFRPFTIVWWDWFTVQANDYRPQLLEDYHEFVLEGQFSFRAFLQFRS